MKLESADQYNMVASEEIKWLSRRPNIVVGKFSSYKINGYMLTIESLWKENTKYWSYGHFIYSQV